ncbi:MAG: chemotaxis protein CheD [Deltaproteobacteria bacterium HGW-Deltaproteobacteria-8]|jgi:chemotaxis protein CheD|nr:MAG: chemotaxis protein CheD [Deltaproteobacteria bacterium HGW-Deltaproteobacteria-8]
MPTNASFGSLGLPIAHVSIGDCAFATRPMLLTTVLGSCVCATFYHPKRQAGGMFHAMLPDASMARHNSRPCTFADQAVASLVERFRVQGMKAADLVVKLFGGANTMISSQPIALREFLDVGKKNVDSARAALASFGLHPVAEDTLGSRGRKLFFATATGQVWLTRLTPGELRTLPPGELG